jgi:PAT family beta-lactamase induction signal transducer AmpG
VTHPGALYLADHIGWKGAYLCMVALMLVGIVATLLAPEPPSDMEPHKPHAGFVETIWAPIHDLLKRLGPMAAAILLLVAGFRVPGYIASAMAIPLFKHQGFTNTIVTVGPSVFDLNVLALHEPGFFQTLTEFVHDVRRHLAR